MNEEFEKWARTVWDVSSVTDPEMSAALEVWNARQPEIDALKAEIVRLTSKISELEDGIDDLNDRFRRANNAD